MPAKMNQAEKKIICTVGEKKMGTNLIGARGRKGGANLQGEKKRNVKAFI